MQGEGQRRIAFKNSKKTKGGIVFSGKEYCGYKGREIADYVGVDEFFPFLLKLFWVKGSGSGWQFNPQMGDAVFPVSGLNHS